MKAIKGLLLVAVMATGLTGCHHLHHPHIDIDVDHPRGPAHCPPGQAKKGNC